MNLENTEEVLVKRSAYRREGGKQKEGRGERFCKMLLRVRNISSLFRLGLVSENLGFSGYYLQLGVFRVLFRVGSSQGTIYSCEFSDTIYSRELSVYFLR